MPASLLFAVAAVSYFIGSVPFGYLLVRLFRSTDIRETGSGNIGATNVIRSGAKGLGALTFLLDALKGYVAVAVAHELAIYFTVTHGTVLQRGWLATAFTWAGALAGVCSVLGHIFPLWLGFRGGKGVATAFGVGVALAPFAALVALAIFLAVVLSSRMVSLASICAAIAMPAAMPFVPRGYGYTHSFSIISGPGHPPVYPAKHFIPGPASPTLTATIAVIAVIVIAKHHANIRRLLAGTEYRFGQKKAAA